MKTTAIGYTENLPASDPASLIERTIEVPAPGPPDLLVEVEAVSVNPVDVKLRAGAPSGGFRVLGFDAVGIVREIGDAGGLHAARQATSSASEQAHPTDGSELQQTLGGTGVHFWRIAVVGEKLACAKDPETGAFFVLYMT